MVRENWIVCDVGGLDKVVDVGDDRIRGGVGCRPLLGIAPNQVQQAAYRTKLVW